MKLFTLAILPLMALSACTIVPEPVTAKQASIGLSGKADSGIISATVNGYQIDQHLRDRYNALIETYGREPAFLPALKPDDGIIVDSDGRIEISRQAMRNLALMNGWRREGRIPFKPPGLLKRLLRATPPEFRHEPREDFEHAMI